MIKTHFLTFAHNETFTGGQPEFSFKKKIKSAELSRERQFRFENKQNFERP